MSEPRSGHHERQLLGLGLLGPLPLVLGAFWLLLRQAPGPLHWGLAATGLGVWLGALLVQRRRVSRALGNISSLLAALRQGDFAIRALKSGGSDALSAALAEINGLADALHEQRTGALEATALLGKVMAEIDVAVFAFDRTQRLRLVNRAGERLLVRPPALGTPASELGLSELLQGPATRIVDVDFPGSAGQWELRRSSFRQGGLPHELLVLSDLRRVLREEERQAWQRIIRVIGHEINNSLAPIRSIAADLRDTLRRPSAERAPDFEEDLASGLAVIERRSGGLDRFMASYARLARLPPPRFEPVDVPSWLRRVVELERRLAVRLADGPGVSIRGDGDQLDQLLINLVRNGVDAALETGGGVDVSWRRLERHVEVVVADEGAGVADTSNLFVPFFTTKPDGSGIGLVLSRQICEAHHGSLTLESRADRRGARARLLLPL